MGLFDDGFGMYATWALVLALVGVLIWFLVFRKPKKTKMASGSYGTVDTKDGYEDEMYEEEGFEDEGYEEETYDEETYDEESYEDDQ